MNYNAKAIIVILGMYLSIYAPAMAQFSAYKPVFSAGLGFSVNAEHDWGQAFDNSAMGASFNSFFINNASSLPSMRVMVSTKYQLHAEYLFSKRFGVECQVNLLSRAIKILEKNRHTSTQTEWSVQIPISFKWAFLLKNEQPLLSLKAGFSLDAMITPDSTIGAGSGTTIYNPNDTTLKTFEKYDWWVYHRHAVTPALELGLELNFPLDDHSSLRLTPHAHVPFKKNLYLKAYRYYRISENNVTTRENLFIFTGTPINIPYFSITLSYMYRFGGK